MADNEERECRICRGEDEPDRPLFHPCKCSGSIKYTHEECLVNWLAQSGSTRCELCNHPFRFEPLYQPNTPTALPTREFFFGVLNLTKKALKTAARIVLVFTVWLFLLPVGTCWIWYALFINSLAHLPRLLASRGPAGVMTDAFYGFLLSAGIVFIFLGVSSLREYIRQFPPENNDANDDNHIEFLLDGDALMPDDIDDEFTDDEDDQHLQPNINNQHLPGAIQGHLAPQHVLNPIERLNRHIMQEQDDINTDEDDRQHDHLDEQVLNEVDELVRDTIDEFAHGDDSDVEVVADDPMMIDESEDEEEEHAYEHPHPLTHHLRAELGQDAPLIDAYVEEESFDEDEDDVDVNMPAIEEEDVIDDNELDDLEMEHHHERQIANAVPEVNEERVAGGGGGEGGAFFGLFDLDPDEVPLEEVVGLRGPIRNLFDNAGTVLVSNAVFLCVFTLIPLLLGRVTLRIFSMRSFPIRLTVAFPAISPLSWDFKSLLKATVTDVSGQMIHTATNASMYWLTSISSLSVLSLKDISKYTFNSAAINVFKNQDSSANPSTFVGEEAPNILSPSIPTDKPVVSYVDNLLIVLLGYGTIALMAVAYIGIMSMLRRRYPRLDSPVTKQIARMLRYIATFIKIVVLIMFEFGIFPLGCGWWLDLCTLDIFGANLQSRMAYCQESPWTCTGLHWIMGIVYMVHISLFISLLRDVVRPELLWFLRNPDDPEFQPFRELVEKPLSRHARRMCLSVVIYVPLIIALVYVPAQLCLKLLPSVFPFRSEDFSHILIDVPFGNLLVGPIIRLLYYGRPGISVQKIVTAWVKTTARFLGIADIVVKDENDGEQGNNNRILRGERVGRIGGVEEHDDDVFEEIDEDEQEFEDANDGQEIRQRFMYVDDDEEIDMVIQRRWVRLRGTTMIISACMTLIVVECALVAIPTIVGRWLMGAFGLAVRHDLHPFLLGLNIVLLGVIGVFKLGKYMGTLETGTLVTVGMPYVVMGMKGGVILSIWLGIIPLAAGLLFELIVMPIRVAHNETPYFCLHQDWALGLLLLKVWACIAMTGGLGAKWRERVMRAREGEIVGVNGNFRRTMEEVVVPVLMSVVTALAVPYSFSRGLLPALGASRWLSNLAYRYGYLAVTCVYCGSEGTRYSVGVLNDLHDSIRDERYLIGKRLIEYNLLEQSPPSPERLH